MSTGSVEVICGPMFSGKTESLIQRLRGAVSSGLRVQAFKPVLDHRYHETHITSHGGKTFTAQTVDRVAELLVAVNPETQVVGIDEAQFFGATLTNACEDLAERGVRVIVAGLDMDYQGRPFEPIPALLAVADSIVKLSAVCAGCRGTATRSHRTAGGHERVQVGAAEAYEALCRACVRRDRTVASTETETERLTRELDEARAALRELAPKCDGCGAVCASRYGAFLYSGSVVYGAWCGKCPTVEPGAEAEYAEALRAAGGAR